MVSIWWSCLTDRGPRSRIDLRPQAMEPPLQRLVSLEKGSPPPRRSLLLFPGQFRCPRMAPQQRCAGPSGRAVRSLGPDIRLSTGPPAAGGRRLQVMLYQAYQRQRDLTAPARALAGLATWTLGELPGSWTDNRLVRRMSAGYEMIERSRLTHERPPFGIALGHRGAARRLPVREEVAVVHPVLDPPALRQGRRRPPADGAAGDRPGRALLDPAPGHRALAAARPRRLRDGLAQRP